MTTPTCPECGGEQRPGDPRGLLFFRHTRGCPIDAAEVQTQCADDARRYTEAHLFTREHFTRDVTPAEARLLTTLGLNVTPTTRTDVDWTGGIRRRTWPGIAPLPQPPAPVTEQPTAEEPAP